MLGSDKYTSDLGEVVFAGPNVPTTRAFGYPLDYGSGWVGTYKINEANGVPERMFNEGWRFTVGYLMIGRFICGIASGLNLSIIAIYISEMAPLEVSGALGSYTQLFISIGILTPSLLGNGLTDIGPGNP